MPFLGLIYKMATVNPAQSRGEGSRGLRPEAWSAVLWGRLGGHQGALLPQKCPKASGCGQCQETGPGPSWADSPLTVWPAHWTASPPPAPSPGCLLHTQPFTHLTTVPSVRSDDFHFTDGGTEASRPGTVQTPGCAPPTLSKPSPHQGLPASGSEWISSIRHH